MLRNHLRLPSSRRLVSDLLYFSRGFPHPSVTRELQLKPVSEARDASEPRIGWGTLFTKAFADVAKRHAVLRQSYLSYPWPHVYQHERSVVRVAVQRQHLGQDWLFFGRIYEPERLSLIELHRQIEEFKTQPIAKVGNFRRQVIVAGLPLLFRRLLWWLSLHFSGRIRAGRFGTFALTSVARENATATLAPSVTTATMIIGPVNDDGAMSVSLVFDHRLMDGLFAARVLGELEEHLNGAICHELKALAKIVA
jgi:hypothetical protein